MKVTELIELLSKIEDKNQEVVAAVHTYTQAYPVGYLEIAGSPLRMASRLPAIPLP